MRSSLPTATAFTAALALLITAGSGVAQVTPASAPGVDNDAAAAAEADAEAREVFKEGRAAFEAEDYELALKRFTRAYGLSGQPKLQFNIGLAYESLGRTDEAITAYESYLKWEPSEEVSAQVEALKKGLAAAEPEPEEKAKSPFTRFQDPKQAPEPKAKLAPAPVEADNAPESEPVAKPSKALPIALLASGGAMVLIGSITGFMALGADSDLDKLCGVKRECDPADAAERDSLAGDIDTYSIITDIMVPLGLVSAGIGAYLMWGVEKTDTSIACGPTGCYGTKSWSF